jgi:hypothetical protein
MGEIDFVRRSGLQRHVRPVAVIPRDDELQFMLKRAVSQRHTRFGSQMFLQRSPQAFDDRDAAAIADGAKALTDVVTSAPVHESMTSKTFALIRDQVSGRCTILVNYLTEETAYLLRGRLSAKAREAQDASRARAESLPAGAGTRFRTC